jgi:hypothetical protein
MHAHSRAIDNKSIARSAHNAPHTFTSDSRHARAAVMYVRSTDTFTSNASRSLPTEAGVAGAAGVLAVLDADVAGISALLRVLSIELIASSSSCTTHATATQHTEHITNTLSLYSECV